MNLNPEYLESLKESEEAIRNNILENYKEGTVLLVKTDFNYRSLHLSVEKIEIINDLEKVKDIHLNPQEFFVINCFNDIACDDFTNEFVFDKKDIKSGDKVYVVTANDGDAYGTFVLGIFTEEPDKDEIIKKYNEFVNSFEEENEEEIDDYLEFYINNIFEIVVS